MHSTIALKTARKLAEKNPRFTQFRSMNAYVSDCMQNRFFLVKSYNTIVGLIDDQQGQFFEFGKYSQTTSKQCTIIAREYDCTKVYVNERI